jgi:hypothetical protein
MAVTRDELEKATPLVDAAEKELDAYLKANWRDRQQLIWRSDALKKLTRAEVQILIKRYPSFKMWYDEGKPHEPDKAIVIEP